MVMSPYTPKSLTLKLAADLDLLDPAAPTDRILELTLAAPRLRQPQVRPAFNLALVIDVSGSMRGEKLAYAQHAALHVLDQLGPDDLITLVAFDDTVATLASAIPAHPLTRRRLRAAVLALQPGGMTNLAAGWLAGCAAVAAGIAQRAPAPASLNRVILLTDGQANLGLTDEEALGQHAADLLSRGVLTSTLGLGSGFNEYLLERLANEGGGSFFYIPDPEQIPAIFGQVLREMAGIVAQAVEIELHFPPACRLHVLGGWRHTFSAGRVRLLVGDLPTGAERQFYLQLQTPPGSVGSRLALHAVARARLEGDLQAEASADLALGYVPAALLARAVRRPELLERAAAVQVAEVAQESLRLERDGHPEEAARRLHGALDQQDALAAPQRRSYRTLAERIGRGDLDEDERKAHYRDAYLRRRGQN
jgi:Ca-activated chloride channel family protein